MIHVFREKEFFYLFLFLFSWRVSQFPTRVVIIIIMDHSYNNNNKWRLHAIFSDPRVWINRGSTMDQHGSTWISRLQPAVLTHGSCVRLMAHASSVLTHASDSWLMRPASHASGVRRPTSHAPCVRLHAPRVRRQTPRPTSHASGVRRQASHAPCVRRPTPHASGVRRQASGVRRQASGVRRSTSIQ